MKDLFLLGMVLTACGVVSITLGHFFSLDSLSVVMVYASILWGTAAIMNMIDWLKWNKIVVKTESASSYD
jgi:hypothetical protein